MAPGHGFSAEAVGEDYEVVGHSRAQYFEADRSKTMSHMLRGAPLERRPDVILPDPGAGFPSDQNDLSDPDRHRPLAVACAVVR